MYLLEVLFGILSHVVHLQALGRSYAEHTKGHSKIVWQIYDTFYGKKGVRRALYDNTLGDSSEQYTQRVIPSNQLLV